MFPKIRNNIIAIVSLWGAYLIASNNHLFGITPYGWFFYVTCLVTVLEGMQIWLIVVDWPTIEKDIKNKTYTENGKEFIEIPEKLKNSVVFLVFMSFLAAIKMRFYKQGFMLIAVWCMYFLLNSFVLPPDIVLAVGFLFWLSVALTVVFVLLLITATALNFVRIRDGIKAGLLEKL